VSAAANGLEALEDESWVSADIWFVDRNMPVMDGLELCQQLRTRGFTGPIIGVTGDALQSDRDAFIAAGASAVLSKPTTSSAVKAVLQSFGFKGSLESSLLPPPLHPGDGEEDMTLNVPMYSVMPDTPALTDPAACVY
jgi:CheY-like chemotaxis protein